MKKTKKRIAMLTLGIIAATTILTGCGSSKTSAPKSAPVETIMETPFSAQSTEEDDYITRVRSVDNSIIAGTSNKDLINLGHNVCDVLDQGYTVSMVVEYMATNGNLTTDEEYRYAGLVIGAAATALCSEYESQVYDYLNQ